MQKVHDVYIPSGDNTILTVCESGILDLTAADPNTYDSVPVFTKGENLWSKDKQSSKLLFFVEY